MKLRIPANREYHRLIEVTGGDNAKMHWDHFMTWVNDMENDYGFNATYRVYFGFYSASSIFWDTPGYRGVDLGFRPAYDLSPGALTSVKEGEQMVMGTLFMAGKPVKVPQNPVYTGDITSYIPGAALELREPLDDPDFQVMGYRIGNAAIADRCLLNMISYTDIEKATVKKEKN